MNVNNSKIKNRPSIKLKIVMFGLCLSANILFPSENVFGVNFPDLPETPLGTYPRKALSPVHNMPRQHKLARTPAKDQGPLGTCVSFAAAACAEFFHKRRLSEAEFTVLAETQLPSTAGGDCKSGLNLGKALKIAQQYGFIDEARVPYENFMRYVARKNGSNKTQELQICRRDSVRDHSGRLIYSAQESYQNTMTEMGYPLQLTGTRSDVGYTLPGIYPIHHVSRDSLAKATRGERVENEERSIGRPMEADIGAVKCALYAGCPVAAALPVFDGCWGAEGNIQMPTKSNKHSGFHAVVLTGFDDDTKKFTFKNSWGVQWGDRGFGFIPCNYVRTYATELVAVGR